MHVKAELLQVGIFFFIHLFARKILLLKKLQIEENKTTLYQTFKIDIIKVGLVFSITNFFITKTSLANKLMRKRIPSFSNSALRAYFPNAYTVGARHIVRFVQGD